MQTEQAAQLRRKWQAKGNPHCDHPRVDREYTLGWDTGDKVCLACGATLPRGTLAPPNS